MKKEADEYCEKIFIVLAMNEEKIGFNKLHEKLIKCGAKMSKPTLIEHLNHLVKGKIIQREREGKQRVYYGLNWKRYKQLQKAKEINQTTLHVITEGERFKSISLDQQTIFATAMLVIGELFYLKLKILSILEPENKLQNTFSYYLIRKLYDIYPQWLHESCIKSEENSRKALRHIDKQIKSLRQIFFETFGKIDIPIRNADDVPSKNAPTNSVLLKRRNNKNTQRHPHGHPTTTPKGYEGYIVEG